MSIHIKDKIQSINLVVGCTIGCPYCYAHKVAKRYHMVENFQQPEFFPNKLRLLERTRPRNLLLTGMSDLAVWKEDWKNQVFETIRNNPQHQFLFLTKRPDLIDLKIHLDHVWFGVTVTHPADLWRIDTLRKNIRAKHYYVTFEPLFEDPGPVNLSGIEWMVIGTMTGSQKQKVRTQPAWVHSLLNQARRQNIPVFMKEELAPIIGEKNMVQELPTTWIYELEKEK